MGVLLWAIAGVGLVILLALATPLQLELAVEKDAEWRYSAALRPFGRIGPRIRLSGRRKKPGAAKKERKNARTKRRYRQREPQRIIRPATRLISDVFGLVRIAHVDVRARFGLGDPGETGQVFGALCPVIYGTSHAKHSRFQIEPVFDRAVLAGRAELALSLIPGALLFPLARFGWHAFGPTR